MQTSRPARALILALTLFTSASLSIAQQPSEPAKTPAPDSPAGSTAESPAVSPAGSPATPPTFSVKVKEVNLLAVVRDKKGQPVNTLDQHDFVLEQDGRAQTITQFAHESDLPLTFGILADTGPGQRKELADERKAGTEFVNRLLREGKDRAFVLHFDKEVELLQDVTSSHDKLARGIDQISVGEAHGSSGNGGSGNGSSGGGRGRGGDDGQRPHYFFGGSMVYDAIFLSSDEVLKGQKGRKAVVLFSDGRDRDSKTTLQHAIESAQRSDTLIYCVFVEPEREEQEHGGGGQRRGGGGYPGGGGPFPGGGGGGYPGGGGGGRQRVPDSTSHEDKNAGKKVLQQISRETGGRYFELSKKLTAAQIYAQIEEEMRHQYSLSYTPDQAANGYHKLHLTTRNADLSVQTREGFYAE
jgi:VWFA-related protein